MKEFVEKLIERLEEKRMEYFITIANTGDEKLDFAYENIGDLIDSITVIVNQLAEEFGGDINVGSKNQGWIPVTERLPEDYDNRFYMCIVENHEEDLPMFLQYYEEIGFGVWQDYYDGHTLGFIDSEFRTNEELGYEKVIAWQQIPEYKPEEKQEEPQPNFYTERFNRVI